MPDDEASKEQWSSDEDRRHNFELRERLDQILDLARKLSRDSSTMSDGELEQARERIEWLAQEIWEAAVFGPLERRHRKPPTEQD